MDGMDDPHKAVLRPRNPGESLKVAETVLRRRDRNLHAQAARAAKVQKLKAFRKTRAENGHVATQSAAKLLQTRKLNKQERGRLKTLARKATPKASKGRRCLLVVRNDRKGGTHEVKTKLRELGLLKRNSGVFVANDDATVKELRVVEPFVFWGPPTLQGVTDLLYKKAFMLDGEDHVPLQDNRAIEHHLSEHGLICVEDLVDSIYTAKDGSFDEVRKILLPMRFQDIRTTAGLTKEVQHVFGNQKKGIDALLSKLLGSNK